MIPQLFIFFALPLATILLSIVLQKVLRSPILATITIFAIFLIVAFVAFSDTLAEALIATIIYTIIAFITASITKIVCQILRRCLSNNSLKTIRGNHLEDDLDENIETETHNMTIDNLLEQNTGATTNITAFQNCPNMVRMQKRGYRRY